MAFKIAQGTRNVETAWFPIDSVTAASLYMGQLVKCDSGSFNGMAPLVVAAGATDVTTVAKTITGIVVGFNNYPMTELNNSTYGAYMASVTSQASQIAIMKMGQFGALGDPAPKVQVALLDGTIFVEAPIYNATYGVAPTLQTVTTGDTTGASMTVTPGADVATVAQLSTTYFRSGLNKGIYRVNLAASTTGHTFTMAFPYAIAAGDTCVILPYRLGDSYVQINSTSDYLGMCFNCAATPATDYFRVQVKELDFAEAGKERIICRFSPAHFAGR
jgi:hypothetical protein